MGHKIHLAYTPMPQLPLRCHLCWLLFLSRPRETNSQIQPSWNRSLLHMETWRPCLPTGFLLGQAEVGTSCLQVLWTPGTCMTRETYLPLPSGEQGRLSPKLLPAPTTTKGQALPLPKLQRAGKVLGGEGLTSQRCCVFLTAPACTFSGGRRTPWKGPIQVPCWILCAAQMP